MSGGKLIPIVLLGVAGTVVGGSLLARMSRSATPPVERSVVPILHIADDKLNFGETWESHRFEWTLPVENRGADVVKVSRVSGSCSCTAIEPQQFEIEPGGTKHIQLVIDLRKDAASDRYGFGVTVELLFAHDPGKGSLEKAERFQVTGKVRRALAVPEELYLGTHSELATRIPPTTLTATAHTKLNSLTATSDRDQLLVRGLASDREFEVSLAAVPKAGPIAGTIELNGTAADGANLPPIRVRVHGTVVQDVQSEPVELIAGSRAVGSEYPTSCTIRSLVGNPIKIVSATAEGEGLVVASWSPDRPEVKLRQRVLKAGQQTQTLRCVVESKGRMYTVVVPVTCFGVDE